MIVSSNISDMMTTGGSLSSVIEIRYVSSESKYYGLQLRDFCDPISTTAAYFRVFQPTVITASPVTVPSNFLGLTVENVGCGTNTATPPWSAGVGYGIHRLLGQGTYWAEIETSDNVFNWTKMDAAVAAARAAGKDVMWNVAYTPPFHAADATIHRSAGSSTNGWPSPPADLAATLQTYPSLNSVKWARFVTAAVQRYAGRIKYYVLWNEPNYRAYSTALQANAVCGNWKDSSDTTPAWTATASSVTGNQNYTQFVRLLSDLGGIVHQYDPSALVLVGEMYGEASSQSSGGKQAGDTTFAALLSAIVAGSLSSSYDGYSWHNYMDEGTGIQGVSLRLDAFLTTVNAKIAAAGAATKPWYYTETGHNLLSSLTYADQKLWLGRNILTAAARGGKCWGMYVWDSLNPSTTQMSLWGTGGTVPLAQDFNNWNNLIPGSVISSAVRLNNGVVCANVNGTPIAV